MKKPQLLSNILQSRVFVSGVTHVEVQLDFRLFENIGQRPKKNVFEAFFIAAGTSVTYSCTVILRIFSVIKSIVSNLNTCCARDRNYILFHVELLSF